MSVTRSISADAALSTSASRSWAALPEWRPLRISTRAWISPSFAADLERARGGMQSSSPKTYRGKLAATGVPRRTRARRSLEAIKALRGASRICSAASCPMPGWSMPATPPIPQRAKFYGDVQERLTDGVAPTCCSSRSSSTASTTRARRGAGAEPALGHYRPWLEDIRKEKPLPARRQARAAVPREVGDRRAAPGTACSTRRWRRCASRSTARS